MPDTLPKVVMDEADIRRTIGRVAHEIVERNGGVAGLALIGVVRKGDYLAARLKEAITAIEPGAVIPVGRLDITLYRDDIGLAGHHPVVRRTEIPFDITGLTVVLVDDVVYTGRTTRAALDALNDFGRPRAIRFAALVDRGGRELPIQPDHVGQTVVVRPSERVKVELTEETGNPDRVWLMQAHDGWVPGED